MSRIPFKPMCIALLAACAADSPVAPPAAPEPAPAALMAAAPVAGPDVVALRSALDDALARVLPSLPAGPARAALGPALESLAAALAGPDPDVVHRTAERSRHALTRYVAGLSAADAATAAADLAAIHLAVDRTIRGDADASDPRNN